MLSVPNVILDFDGTLVQENSSRVFEEIILAELSGRWGRMWRWIYRQQTLWAGLGFSALSRLARGRDARLLLAIMLTQRHIRGRERALLHQTAARLKLTDELSIIYARPFTILSTGLAPVIQAFLELHPELPCEQVIASPAHITHRGLVAHLTTPHTKVANLDRPGAYAYITDYHHEATLLHRHLGGRPNLTTQPLADGRSLYTLAID